MKKTLLIAAASTLSFTLSSMSYAGNIEKAERYVAPLNVVETNVGANTKQEITAKAVGFSSNAEVQTRSIDGDVKFMSNPEVQELGTFGSSSCNIFMWCLILWTF